MSAPEARISDTAACRSPWKVRGAARHQAPAELLKRPGDIARVEWAAVLHRNHVPLGLPGILGRLGLLSLPRSSASGAVAGGRFWGPAVEIVNGMPVIQKGLWAFDIDLVSAVAHFERRIEGQRADLQHATHLTQMGSHIWLTI